MKTLINANVLRDRITQSWQEGAINAADMREVMRLIDEIKPEDEWTPVADRLPESDGEYLVTAVNDCGVRQRRVSSFVLFNDGTCYSWGIETGRIGHGADERPTYKVLAWTELPPEWEE